MDKGNHIGKRVIIISDDAFLFNVIDANLKHIHPRPYCLAPSSKRENQAGPIDLIIVATSSPTSEPLVALFSADLTEHIGRTPLLIISDRSFEANIEGKIFHLDFPFESYTLRCQVTALLANNGQIL